MIGEPTTPSKDPMPTEDAITEEEIGALFDALEPLAAAVIPPATEPGELRDKIFPSMNVTAMLSMAVSLKRIADALDSCQNEAGILQVEITL